MKQPFLDEQTVAGERLRQILGAVAVAADGDDRLDERMCVCLTDPWCRRQVRWRARNSLKRFRLSQDWQDDIEHQTLVILADKLLRGRLHPAASVDSGEQALAWLCVVIRRACDQAARGLSRPQRFENASRWTEPVRSTSATLDLRFDMAAAIDQLAEPSHSVVLLSKQGHSLVDVAGMTRLSYKQTWCAFADGVKRLRRALADYQLRGFA